MIARGGYSSSVREALGGGSSLDTDLLKNEVPKVHRNTVSDGIQYDSLLFSQIGTMFGWEPIEH